MVGTGRALAVVILRVLVSSRLGIELFNVDVSTTVADYDEWTYDGLKSRGYKNVVVCFIKLASNSTGITEHLQISLKNNFKASVVATEETE